MENSWKNSSGTTRAILAAAAILAVQSLPGNLYAQVQEKNKPGVSSSKPMEYLKIKWGEIKLTVVGVDNGAPVFKNDKGEFFTVDSRTGDLNFIKPDEFAAFTYQKIEMDYGDTKRKSSQATSRSSMGHIKLKGDKVAQVNIVGTDAQGHTLMKNSRGENFYLDPVTGDLIFVKI